MNIMGNLRTFLDLITSPEANVNLIAPGIVAALTLIGLICTIYTQIKKDSCDPLNITFAPIALLLGFFILLMLPYFNIVEVHENIDIQLMGNALVCVEDDNAIVKRLSEEERRLYGYGDVQPKLVTNTRYYPFLNPQSTSEILLFQYADDEYWPKRGR